MWMAIEVYLSLRKRQMNLNWLVVGVLWGSFPQSGNSRKFIIAPCNYRLGSVIQQYMTVLLHYSNNHPLLVLRFHHFIFLRTTGKASL